MARGSETESAAAQRGTGAEPAISTLSAVLGGAALWVLCAGLAELLSHGHLPFPSPALAGLTRPEIFFLPLIGLGWVLFELAVIYLVTRRRAVPDMASRVPSRATAWREMLALIVYGAAVLIAGVFVGHAIGHHAIGMHLPGSLFGLTDRVLPREVWAWSAYNFVFFALLPYVVFRRRGYSREQLNLRSANVRNDTLLIFVILGLELLSEYSALRVLFSLAPHQLELGLPLSFMVHLLGTGLPVMIFIYSLLFPRYMKLTHSVAATTILGAVTYALVHLTEYWTVYDSANHAVLSVVFIILVFGAPGLVKSFLTVRTGNAWVHLWGYHAIVPHVTVDTPNIVKIFAIR